MFVRNYISCRQLVGYSLRKEYLEIFDSLVVLVKDHIREGYASFILDDVAIILESFDDFCGVYVKTGTYGNDHLLKSVSSFYCVVAVDFVFDLGFLGGGKHHGTHAQCIIIGLGYDDKPVGLYAAPNCHPVLVVLFLFTTHNVDGLGCHYGIVKRHLISRLGGFLVDVCSYTGIIAILDGKIILRTVFSLVIGGVHSLVKDCFPYLMLADAGLL